MLLQQAGWIATDIENLTVTILALDSLCNNDILIYVLLISTTARKKTHNFQWYMFNIFPASTLA